MPSEYLNNKVFEKIINKFQTSKRSKARYELIIEDIETRRNNPQNKQLLESNLSSLHTYNQIHKESQQELAVVFYTLSENIVRYAKFNLIDDDDAIQEGVMICFDKIDRFDPEKGKAFNYMTTCILNHFRQLYRTARNYNELKKKYHDFLNLHINHTIIKNGKEISLYGTNKNY